MRLLALLPLLLASGCYHAAGHDKTLMLAPAGMDSRHYALSRVDRSMQVRLALTNGGWLQGGISQLDSAAITIAGLDDFITVPLGEIDAAWVRPDYSGAGAGLGALVVGLAGALVTGIGSGIYGGGSGRAVVLGGIAGAAVGAGLGGVAGGVMAEWQPLHWPPRAPR